MWQNPRHDGRVYCEKTGRGMQVVDDVDTCCVASVEDVTFTCPQRAPALDVRDVGKKTPRANLSHLTTSFLASS